MVTLSPIATPPFCLIESHSLSCAPDQEDKLTRKIELIFDRLIKSPFVQTCLTTLSLLGFSYLCLTESLVVPLPLFLLVTLTASVALAFFIIDHRHFLWFELSLSFVKIENLMTSIANQLTSSIKEREWFNEIILEENHPGKLFLSAIPQSSMEHHSHFLQLASKVNGLAILIFLKDFENQTSWFLGDPVRSTDWKELKVEHKQIEIFDLSPLSIQEFNESADYIHKHLISNKVVVVNCKAGRGRSALGTIGYIMKYKRSETAKLEGKDFVHKAIKFVTHCRPQVFLTAEQIQSLYAYETSLS